MIKKGDFIEIEFVGRLKLTNQIFDLTDENLAKQNNVHNPKIKYGPQIVCIGQNQLVKGLDEFLIDKELKEYKVELTPEQAFGPKNPKLIKIVSMSAFKDQNVKPFPGLQLNIDGLFAMVKTVSGGRIVLDFNHPLAGRDVIYEIKILRKVTDIKEKLKSIFLNAFNKEFKFDIKDNKLIIKEDLSEQVQKALENKLKELIPEIKEVKFSKEQEVKKEEVKEEKKKQNK